MFGPIKISDLVTRNRGIYISNSSNNFSQSLSLYLSSFGIPTYQLPSSQPLIPSPVVLVHFATSSTTGLESTLDLTSHLYNYLQVASSAGSQFLLILPRNSSSLHTTAKLMVNQFIQSHPHLQATVMEINPQDSPDRVASVAAKVFLPRLSALTSPPIPHPHTKLKKLLRLTQAIVCSWVVVWALFIFQSALLYLFFHCSLSSLKSARWQQSLVCVRGISLLSTLLPLQSYVAVGARPAMVLLGFPPSTSFSLLVDISDNLYWANQVGLSGLPYYQNLVSATSVDFSPDTSSLSYALTRLSQSLSSTQKNLKADPQVLSQSPLFRSLSAQLDQYLRVCTKLLYLVPDLPSLLAFSGDRTYVVLIQDPAVPRPLGGTISQVGTLSLRHGKLVDVHLQPASSIDAQISGRVNSPPSFASATNRPDWTFSDTLWEPDFAASYQLSSWYLTHAWPTPVDGIIASPHTFPDQTYLSRLTVSQNIDLLLSFLTDLESHQLMFLPQTNSAVFSRVGWDGGIRPSSCHQASCLSQLVYVTDSALTPAVSGKYLTRDTHLSISINSDHISSTLDLVYKFVMPNPLPSDSPYFTRIILPPSTSLSGVTLDDTPLDTATYSVSRSETSNTFSLLHNLASSKPTRLSLTFDHPISTQPQLPYQLTLLNQPGRLEDPFALTIIYPQRWQVQASIKPKFAAGGQLQYNGLLKSPQNYSFDFQTIK